MATVYCDNCGTSLLDESARFCRACGKPTPASEAATRRFDERAQVENPTSPVGSFTTPAYMAPLEMPPGEQTNDLRQKKQKRNLIILACMMGIMIVALVGLLAFLSFGIGPQLGTAPPPPPPEFDRPPPPPPPPPPLEPGAAGPTTIDKSLIYPGSNQETLVSDEQGTKVVRLQSDDRITKVVEWYTSRLPAAKKLSILRQTILSSGTLRVIITGSDEGTQIIITRGDGDN